MLHASLAELLYHGFLSSHMNPTFSVSRRMRPEENFVACLRPLVATALKEHRCDMITIMAGHTTIDSESAYGRGFLTLERLGAQRHQYDSGGEELMNNWKLARQGLPLRQIAPLEKK